MIRDFWEASHSTLFLGNPTPHHLSLILYIAGKLGWQIVYWIDGRSCFHGGWSV